MYKLKNVPLTISGILKDGWELYKYTIKYLLPWSFIIAVVHVIPFHFGYVGIYHLKRGGGLAFSWLAILIYIALLFIEAYFIIVLFYTIYLKATEQKIDFRAIFDVAKSLLFSLYFAMLLYFLAVNFGLVLFIFPAVFIGILFVLFLPFIVCDRQNVVRAFESSARLVWGHWWQTFFVLAIPYALSYSVRSFARFTPFGDNHWFLVGDIVLVTFFLPYFYTVLYLQFHNLKYIKSLPSAVSGEPRTQS